MTKKIVQRKGTDKKALGCLCALLASSLTGMSDDVVIQSFDLSGRIAFNKVTNAARYRVEWSSTLGNSWTSFQAAADALDGITSPGLGVVTVSVPMVYRVVASPLPPGMVLIPAGSFAMGNATNVFPVDEGYIYEVPQHVVYVSGFYLDQYEVTASLWSNVTSWASTNGYGFENVGRGKTTNHPVQTVNWYDAAKWCNARSEKEGLTPCYTTNGVTYKTGNNSNVVCDWSANGYRLPTEAEWEKAARGGVANTRFPWTDYTNNIAHAKANYYGQSGSYSYDLSIGYHLTFSFGGVLPYTGRVGYFAPNGYGVYDMAGNVCEWCWDWFDESYYGNSPGTDPTGPAGPLRYRMVRGGSWNAFGYNARVACRDYTIDPTLEYNDLGFRCARGGL